MDEKKHVSITVGFLRYMVVHSLRLQQEAM